MVKRSNKAHNKGCYRTAGVARLIRAWWSWSQSDKSNWADKRQQVQSDQALIAYQKHLQLLLQDCCEKHAQQNAANYDCSQLHCCRHGFWPTGWSPGHNGLSTPPEVKSPLVWLSSSNTRAYEGLHKTQEVTLLPSSERLKAKLPSACPHLSSTTQQLHKTAFTEKENKQAIYCQKIKKSLRSSDCKQTHFARKHYKSLWDVPV